MGVPGGVGRAQGRRGGRAGPPRAPQRVVFGCAAGRRARCCCRANLPRCNCSFLYRVFSPGDDTTNNTAGKGPRTVPCVPPAPRMRAAVRTAQARSRAC